MDTIETIGRQDAVGYFLLVAVSAQQHSDGKTIDRIGQAPYSAQLLVNGVEVPFVETVVEIFKRMNANIDDKVDARIAEFVASKFGKLQTAIDEATNLITNAANTLKE